MSTTAMPQSPRAPRFDHPRPSSKRSSRNSSPHPPSRTSAKYPFLKMTSQTGLHGSHGSPSSSSLRQLPRSSQRKGSLGSIASDRPPTPVSKGSVKDSQHGSHQGPQSTFLQEKLQHERRSEIQRGLVRLEMTTAGSTGNPGTTDAPPTGPNSPDAGWGILQDGAGDNNWGTAMKEDERTISTLHKQNFDLKLELYHRRERQAELESKIDVLEAEKSEVEETNVKLIQEVEKRDKAVTEAVQMIVSLESRIELLLREREMVRQLDRDRSILSTLDHSASGTLIDQATNQINSKHDLARMPSFLSERTENTENLRNVYLDSQVSLVNTSKADSRVDNNGFVSPSMSVLSETSFLSIYGRGINGATSSPPDVPRSVPGRPVANGQRSISMPLQHSKPSRAGGAGHSIGRIGVTGSTENAEASTPTQTLQDLDKPQRPDHVALHITPTTKDGGKGATLKTITPQPMLRVRNDRDRLPRKVIADDPGANTQGLPPTPDTVTSSMLNRSQVSDEGARRDPAPDQPKYPVLSRMTLDNTDQVEPGHWRFKPSATAQPPSVTAFTGRQDASAAAYYEHRLPLLRRPRSADETTISRHKNDWDSCSEGDEIGSEASSFDYWMREGLRPSQGGTNGKKSRTGASRVSSNREAPNLFAFTSDDEDWPSNDMYGSGAGYASVGAPLAQAMDALGASLPPPETGLFGSGLAGSSSPRPEGTSVAAPPAPYRRSSLNARTSAPGTPRTARAPGPPAKHVRNDHTRTRSVSAQVTSSSKPGAWSTHNSSDETLAAAARPQPPQQDNAPQKRHYPPNASQPQAACRSRKGAITSLFRRSLGSTGFIPQLSASVPASHSPFSPPPHKDVPPADTGAPFWERQNDPLPDDASATPPPIMRKRGSGAAIANTNGEEERGGIVPSGTRAARATTVTASGPGLGAGLGRVLAAQEGGAPLHSPSSHGPIPNHNADQEAPPAQASHPHGRRWFNRLKHGGS